MSNIVVNSTNEVREMKEYHSLGEFVVRCRRDRAEHFSSTCFVVPLSCDNNWITHICNYLYVIEFYASTRLARRLERREDVWK